MTTMKDITRTWEGCFTSGARQRGLRTVSGFGYIDDGVHIATVALVVGGRAGSLRVTWWVNAKPLALDDVLWSAFLPDLIVSAAKRRSLRVNGWYAAPALELGRGEYVVPSAADPGPEVDDVLDAFERLRDEYVRAVPDPVAFARLLGSLPEEEAARPAGRLREALALIIADRRSEASALLDRELAAHRTGPMAGPEGGVFTVLARALAASAE